MAGACAASLSEARARTYSRAHGAPLRPLRPAPPGPGGGAAPRGGLPRRGADAAETEERAFYERRAPADWLADLAPLGTDWRKPFLTTAPWLVVVFRLDYEPAVLADGTEHRHKNYYVQESVGIAVGFLLAALHAAGLATLTHTPSPMAFLGRVLGRPRHERPYLIIPVGHPAPGARVPDLGRRALDEVRVFV